ncbi:MAG: hypothetical protein JWQ82_246, partial [Tardiphaga sp.]|nr:hypothetical protein [Tardiphaga sp.]
MEQEGGGFKIKDRIFYRNAKSLLSRGGISVQWNWRRFSQNGQIVQITVNLPIYNSV